MLIKRCRTFALLPGVTIGDIGKKMGRDGVDNGYIQFTNVRIPRAYMLMKHTQVTREGEVREPPLAQLTYGALLQGRTAMVADAANVSKKALVIAVRYAAVRRQFKTTGKEFENQILDYPIHQRRLLPLLSQAVAMGFTALQMTQMFETLNAQLESFGADADEASTKEVIEKLKEVHATSAGLKAFCTWNGLETIEKCRASCGGHGYSAYTGLSSMYNDQAVQCTWEGDNTILTLQAGRSLVSSYDDAKKGKKLPGGTSYLNSMPEILTIKCGKDEDTLKPKTINDAWACVAANVVKNAAEAYERYMSEGKDKDEALEMCSQERFVAAKVHTAGYIYRQFQEAVELLDQTEDKSNGVVKTLEKICRLYGLWSIEENSGAFLKYGYYSASQMDLITTEVTALCLELRQCAVPLVDAFNYSDHIVSQECFRKLKSSLTILLCCRSTHLWECITVMFIKSTSIVLRNRIHSNQFIHVSLILSRFSLSNRTDHDESMIDFDRLIKPLLEREPLEMDDADEMALDDEIQEIKEDREEAAAEADKEKMGEVKDEIEKGQEGAGGGNNASAQK